MRFEQPLDDAIGALSLVRILRTLALAPPELNLTGRGVARRAGISHPQASRSLRSLARQGLVVERRFGTYALYEFNRRHVLAGPLRMLFEFEEAVGEDLFTFLARAVAERSRHVRAALLFGDVVWGPQDRSGELELAVLCAPDRELDVEAAMVDLGDEVRRRYGNPLRVLVDSRKRAIECVRQNEGPWPRIARDGIPVFRLFPRVR
jgi:DNA-binding transcriptional ArsR family regulator